MTTTDQENRQRNRRSSSISEYSSLFRNAGPQTGTLLSASRHPSISMRKDSIGSILGMGMPGVMSAANESAVEDPPGSPDNGTLSELRSSLSSSSSSSNGITAPRQVKPPQRAMTDEFPQPVNPLGRRLSQGARAIMYNGQRLRGENTTLATDKAEGARHARTVSQSSAVSPDPGMTVSPGASPIIGTADPGKQIKRRMSPTGERMLRGDLAFH